MLTNLRAALPLLINGEGNESGQGMIEYGLLVGLISIAAIAVIVLLGPQLTTIFGSVVNSL
jgi:pilus assembly protein Flp/PilA